MVKRLMMMVGVVAALTAPVHADWLTGFEPPDYTGSAAGTLLTGQQGWYNPVAGSNDYNVFTYAGNTYGIIPNPAGSEQFIGGISLGGTAYARVQRDFAWADNDSWKLTIDVATLYTGTLPATQNLGSFSLQPSTAAIYWQWLLTWVDPNTATQFHAGYLTNESSALPVYPGPEWQNLAVNNWYRLSTTFRFSNNEIIECSIQDLTGGGPEIIVQPPGWHLIQLYGPALPTGMRAFSGGTTAGNVCAWDNLDIALGPPPPTGACCNDATATCTEGVLLPDCLAQGGRFAADTLCADISPPCGGGACCLYPDCFDMMGPECAAIGGSFHPAVGCATYICLPECPGGTLYGQRPFYTTEAWAFNTSDSAGGYLCAERYTGAFGQIEDLHWWGINAACCWAACTENPMAFDITFYSDVNGAPGSVVASFPGQLINGTDTGLNYGGIANMQYYTFTLPTPLVQPTGWVSIQGSNGDTCWFLWAGSPQGDGSSLQNGGTVVPDLSLCITGTAMDLYGACCDDTIPTCTDNVLGQNCLPPLRWTWNTACADLNPICGAGACCYGPTGARQCIEVLAAECDALFGTFVGPLTTCDPNPCVGACCGPVVGDCVTTDQAYCDDVIGGQFLGGGTACGVDPCPPQNDLCENATVVDGPYPVTLLGQSTRAATVDCPAVLNWPAVWYLLNMPETPSGCVDVSIEYCPTTVDLSTAGIVYVPDCSCAGYVIGTYMFQTCAASGRLGLTLNFTGFTGTQMLIPTYLIDATGAGVDFDVKFTVIECPQCPCPGGETPEGEPVCSNEYVDATNGGCNSTPAVFGTIACGDTICGSSGTYLFSGGQYRDTDWFQLTTTAPKIFTWTVTGQFPTLIFVIDGTAGCPGVALLSATANACVPATITTGILPAGTYWFWVGPSVFSGVACGSPYVATLTCQGFCGTCMGDANGDAVVDGLDVQAFVDAAVSGAANDCADFDGGGTIDAGDIPMFIVTLLENSGPCPVPPCADFTLEAPGTINGDTCGAGDDCSLRPGPEQVVEITIPSDGNWTFALCNTSPGWDTYIFLSADCCGSPLYYNDDFCTTYSLLSQIGPVALTAGTYYLDIEAFSSGSCGAWVLDVTGP